MSTPVVDPKGNCSLCGGTHYGTGYYYCPYACKTCGVNTEPTCERPDCERPKSSPAQDSSRG